MRKNCACPRAKVVPAPLQDAPRALEANRDRGTPFRSISRDLDSGLARCRLDQSRSRWRPAVTGMAILLQIDQSTADPVRRTPRLGAFRNGPVPDGRT